MSDLRRQLDTCILPYVTRPGQYVGGELNAVAKDHREMDLVVALAFPDLYAIGMSHLGIQILYSLLNDQPRLAAERVYAPAPDLEALLRQEGLPLFSWETRTPLHRFDLIGFSLQYELGAANLLNMLDLGGIPIWSAERTESDPLIIAGGEGACTPEPLADFIDLFVIGDGEDALLDLVGLLSELKRAKAPRRDVLIEAARRIPGVYVPSLYRVSYQPDGTVAAVEPTVSGVPERITRAHLKDLDAAPYPTAPVVPNTETVHDRITLEIARGCPRGCRYCQAGHTRRPLRTRSPDRLVEIARETHRRTGYDEISLCSLSTGDYPKLDALLERLNQEFAARRVSLSMPSLRIEKEVLRLPGLISVVRKSGLTFAPEAASPRLRRRIGKEIKDETLFEVVEEAYRCGWRTIKLYFMIGLPGETDAEVEAIAGMARKVSNLRGKVAGGAGKVNLTLAPFVPRPHTPFQWEPMADLECLRRRRQELLHRVRSRKIALKFHRIEHSFLEAIIARGDRRVGRLIHQAWKNGCRLDAWGEYFDFAKWQAALSETGLDAAFYVHRRRGEAEVFPWDHIDVGVSKQALLKEKRRSEAMEQ